MKIDKILVRNVLTEEVGVIRRDWFQNPAINPDGLLEEVDYLPGGCVGCGTADPAPVVLETILKDEDSTDYPDEEEEDN